MTFLRRLSDIHKTSWTRFEDNIKFSYIMAVWSYIRIFIYETKREMEGIYTTNIKGTSGICYTHCNIQSLWQHFWGCENVFLRAWQNFTFYSIIPAIYKLSESTVLKTTCKVISYNAIFFSSNDTIDVQISKCQYTYILYCISIFWMVKFA